MNVGPILRLAAAKLAATAALAALNRTLELGDLPPTLPGQSHDWAWRLGRVRYTTLGDGPPLLLLHSPNACASSYEMRKVFAPLAERFTVYAPDLLGFGKSERPPLEYTGERYADLVTDFLDEVIGRPAVVVASSLGSAYAVVAAVRRPELVDRLVLICPAGDTSSDPTNPTLETVYWALRLPVYGQAAFNAIVSRPSIRHFLGQHFYDPSAVADQLVEQNWATAHQSNARYAPAAFVSGRLNYPLRAYFKRVEQPVLLAWGAEARQTPLDHGRELAALNPHAELRVFERCGLLPHDERADELVPEVLAFGDRSD